MHFVKDRKGLLWKEDSCQDKILEWMYAHMAGRILLRLLTRPAVSRFGGKILDTGISRILITPFIYSDFIAGQDSDEIHP